MLDSTIKLKCGREQTFVHIHNPKSAGSMFNQILAANFGPKFIRDIPLISYLKYSEYDIRQLFYAYPQTCFSSHNYSLKSIPISDRYKVISFAFVRNPFDKVISSYFYLRNRDLTAPWHITRQLSLGELIDYMIEHDDFNPFYLDTPQLDWIYGESGSKISDVEQKLDLGNSYIFPTERFDEACVLLEKLFPDHLPDCSYPQKINESTKDYILSAGELSKIPNLPWIENDKELHHFSNCNLDKLIEEHFDTENSFRHKLKSFKIRCKRHRPGEEFQSIKPASFRQKMARKAIALLKNYT